MGIEVANYVNQLVATNPLSGDPKSEGDDHLRLLKAVLLATFPNIAGAVTLTHTQINNLSSDIATAIATAVLKTGDQTVAGIKTFAASPVLPGNASTNLQAVPKQQLDAVVAPANLAPTLFVPATAVELSSGSSATLSSSVPSWARELMVVLDSVSSDSTGNLSLTLGDSGGIETTGYSGLVIEQGSTTSSLSSGFPLTAVSVAAAAWSGIARFVRIDSGSNSYWVAESTLGRNDAATRPNEMIGRKQLSGALTTVVLNVGSGAFNGGRAQLFWR